MEIIKYPKVYSPSNTIDRLKILQQYQQINLVGSWEWDMESDFVLWTDQMFGIYEIPVEPNNLILLENIFGFIDPGDLSIVKAKMEELSSIGSQEYEFRIITNSGKTKLLNACCHIIWTEKGSVCMRGVVEDITKQRNLEIQLAELKNKSEKLLDEKNKELELLDAELATFSYIASHDMQEPLRKIQAFSDLILNKEFHNLSAAAKGYFNRMSVSAQRMQKMIIDLLAFSRTNTMDKIFEEVDLNQLMELVKADLKEKIRGKQVIIECDPLPVARVIRLQFRQLLENLLSNSLKFQKPGVVPKIQITSEIIQPGIEKKQTGPVSKSFIKISVTDNGIGFDMEYAEQIFLLFQRLNGRSEYTGSGIGLAVCKKIVGNHNGYITTFSKPGEGATFNVFIPEKEIS